MKGAMSRLTFYQSVIIPGLLLWSNVLTMVSSEAILTSNNGDEGVVTICPNEVVNLTCQTTSAGALAWVDGNNNFLATFSVSDNVNKVETSGSTYKFTLTEKDGNNLTSVVTINTTMSLTISCSADGVTDFAQIMISIKDTPSAPSNVTVTDVDIDTISLQWTNVSTADYYRVSITPPPSGGICQSGTCVFTGINATIGQLAVDEYDICVRGVNCAGNGNCTSIKQDTIPKATVEIDVDFNHDDSNDTSTAIVCPNTEINITCQTAGALAWILPSNDLFTFTSSDSPGDGDNREGFTFTLLEKDGVEFTSLATTKRNTSFNITCSPTGMPGIPENTLVSVTVLETLSQPRNLSVSSSCHDYIQLEWIHNEFADEYMITVSPSPVAGLCINGACDTNSVVCDEDSELCSVSITGLSPFTEYSYTVSGVNCVGIGNPATLTHTVSLKAPPQLEITDLDVLQDDGSLFATLYWKPVPTTCETPPVVEYTIIVSSVGDPKYYHTSDCCNFTIPKLVDCGGQYSFTMFARNLVGRGLSAIPVVPESSGTLSQSISVSSVTYKSAVLAVSVTECLIPLVVNITTELSMMSREVISVQNFSYATSLDILDLEDDVMYNMTVTVYYRKDNDTVLPLDKQALAFTTPYNFLSFRNIAFGAVAGFGVLGLFLFILIIVIGIFCIREAKIKKKHRSDLRRQKTRHETNMMEIRQDITDVQENINNLLTKQPETTSQPLVYNTPQVPPQTPQLYPQLQEYNVDPPPPPYSAAGTDL